MRTLWTYTILCFTALGLYALSLTPAAAQRFDQSETARTRAVKLPQINFDRDNPYFRDLLTLEKQIALLQKMIDREKRIQSILDSFEKIGIDAELPAPSRDWCEQVPANMSCAYHYPNMYDDFNIEDFDPILPESEQIRADMAMLPEMPDLPDYEDESDEEKEQKANFVRASSQNPLEALDFKPLHLSEQSEESRKILKGKELAWTDIRCIGSECQAVVSPISFASSKGQKVNEIMKRIRFTIFPGDALPNGGVVKNISADGVSIEQPDGSTKMLAPAPQ